MRLTGRGLPAICNEIIERIKKSEDKIPENTAKRLMVSFRRKRRFTLMRQLADEIIRSGVRAPQVRRQYAQALIDDGQLDEAESVLKRSFRIQRRNAGGGSGGTWPHRSHL